jgi:hypothetical protein
LPALHALKERNILSSNKIMMPKSNTARKPNNKHPFISENSGTPRHKKHFGNIFVNKGPYFYFYHREERRFNKQAATGFFMDLYKI